MNTKDDVIFVVGVANALLDVCDGARKKDCAGYNRFDTRIVRDIIHKLGFYDDADLRKVNALKKILIKYKNQILGMGFDYDRLVKIDFGIKPKNDKASVEYDDIIKTVKLFAPYNPQFVAEIRGLARWDRDTKSWNCPPKNAEMAIKALLKYYPDTPIPDIPKPEDTPFGHVSLIDGKVIIKAPYDAHLVADIRTFKSRRFDGNDKAWMIGIISKGTIDKMRKIIADYNLSASPEINQYLGNKAKEFDELERLKNASIEASKSVSADITIPDLKEGLTLYPFQAAGVNFTEMHNGRALIADEMGLGKTIQALAWLQLHKDVRPALVICPASLKENWKRETAKWLNPTPNIEVVNGGKNNTLHNNADIYILNYDIVKKHLDALKALGIKAIIIDECHYIKNYKAQRTKAVIGLCEGVDHIITLSGTPMLNRPIELYTTLNILAPKHFAKFWDYAKRYCAPQQSRWGWDLSGASNLDELQVKLRESCMIRRLKADVLKELPDKQKCTVVLSPEKEAWDDYLYALNNLKAWLRNRKFEDDEDADTKATKSMKAEFLVRINELRQIVGRAKLEGAKEWIRNFLESSQGKLVVFAHHKEIIKSILKDDEFKGLVVGFTGEENTVARQKAIDDFTQNPKIKLLVASFLTGGLGLNLQVASDVVILELPWRPADIRQAEDRCHRIGQTKAVTTWYLLCAHSIDEELVRILNEKLKVTVEALDPEAEEKIQNSLIKFLVGDD